MVRNRAFGQIMDEGDKPAFFKILRKEEFSSEIIRRIPRCFIRSFKLVLKVPWGSSWPVEVSKNPEFYYMADDGWNQFVDDNALGEDEFLTFTHEGNMCFNVRIFEPNGTELLRPRKSATFDSSPGQNIYKDVKTEEIDSSSESRHPGFTTAESPGGRLMKQKRERNLTKKKAVGTKKSKKSKNKKADTVCNDYEDCSSSLVPEFKLTIKKSHLVYLGIPKTFKEMHMPYETRTFKIHHPKGKRSWEVTYMASDVQSKFSAGWIRVAKELGLVVGDICTFKLIKPTEMSLKVFKITLHDDDDDDVSKV